MKKMILILATTALPILGFAKDDDQLKQATSIAKQELEKFDALDFDHYSNQKWDQIKLTHSANVKVHWPDGHITIGLNEHIEDLKKMFVFMPDLQVAEHVVRIVGVNAGSSLKSQHPKKIEKLNLKDVEWTSVIGTMTGTFSEPMPIGQGNFIPPTGKKVHMTMVTVSHWTKEGVMDEEYLFFDNDTFAKQLGLK